MGMTTITSSSARRETTRRKAERGTNALHALCVSAAAIGLTACVTLIATFIACTFSSCDHKDLYFPSSPLAEVRVKFDWSAAPGARAEGMSAFFFPEQGGGPIRCDFSDPAGGTARIPWGDYRVIYLNNDTETILLRGTESYETFEIYTRPTSVGETMSTRSEPRGANPGDEPVVLAPEEVWGGSFTGVRLAVGGEQPYTLVLPVHPKVCTCSFEVRAVENLKYVSSVGASFSGMSGSLFMGDGSVSGQGSMIPFPADSDGKSVITGSTFTFGLSAEAGATHVLTLYLILADGSKFYYRFDVTRQVNEAPDKRHVRIVLEGLPLPKPIVNGGGFHPSVDDWETEEIPLGV